jgi:hypothetical protein
MQTQHLATQPFRLDVGLPTVVNGVAATARAARARLVDNVFSGNWNDGRPPAPLRRARLASPTADLHNDASHTCASAEAERIERFSALDGPTERVLAEELVKQRVQRRIDRSAAVWELLDKGKELW